ncbi:MAG: immunoglobulin domain-containing protein [Ignavibacteria bacterium]|nr:immunoglobulin domain-containing protein [Ignavibacteria bacterium]
MRHLYVLMAILATTCIAAFGTPKPHVFVGNDGRWPSEVLYGAATPNSMIWITKTGMIIDQRLKDATGVVMTQKVRLSVVGSKGSEDVILTKSSDMPTVSILTSGAGESPLQTASTVTVRNVLKGIHVEYVWEGYQIRYNVHADAGTRVPNPLFAVKGAKTVNATANGIRCTTSLGEFTMTGIISYQDVASNTRKTSSTVVSNEFGFNVANRDMGKALTIDPVVAVLGLRGGADEGVTAMRINKDGDIVVCGWTTSFDFVVPTGGLNTTGSAGEDGFIAVVRPDLKTVKHWTYITGAKNERVRDIALNSKGEVWAVGETNSADFPVKGTTMGQTYSGTVDGFALLLSADLSTEIAGMYLAGDKEDRPTGVIVNPSDLAVIVGSTNSTSGITNVPGHKNANNGKSDGFVVFVHAKMLNITYFTFFGGPDDDFFTNVALDANSAILVCGSTNSNQFETFPVKTAVFVPGDGYYTYDHWEETGVNSYDVDYNGGTSDAVVVKFNSIGALVFSTYFGGTKDDVATDVFADAEGSVYFVGQTRSPNLATLPNSPYVGGADGFLGVLSKDGLKLRGAAYLGGTGDDFITSAVLDANNVVVATGHTNSSDFPVIGAGANYNQFGGFDGFVTKFSVEEVKQSTFVGWLGNDYPVSIVKDALGDNFIAGRTESSFPGSPLKGAGDAFVAKWASGLVTYNGPAPIDPICREKSVSVRWSTSELASTEEYAVDFSQDNGTTWTEIGSKIKSKSFNYIIPAEVPGDAMCKFRVRTAHGHEVSTATALNILVPPTVVSAPEPITSCPDKEIKLKFDALGSSVTVQWRKNGLPISGVTGLELTIAAAQTTDAGSYDVVITNNCAAVTSSAVMVEVAAEPIIAVQPKSQSVANGVDVVLGVEARGQDMRFEWKHDGTVLPGSEFQAPVITIKSVSQTDAGKYQCVIKSACGTSTTEEASIVVGPNGVNDDPALNGKLLAIHPQPASEFVNVTIPQLNSSASIIIRNSQGAEVLRSVIPAQNANGQVQVSIGQLATGTYTLQLVSNGQVLSTMLSVVR